MYEATPHRSYEIHNARPLSGNWESPIERGHPRREEERVQPYHGEVVDLTSPTMNAVPSTQAPQSTAEDPAVLGDPSRQPSHGDSNSTSFQRWSTPRPQADEQYKARPSSHGEGSMTDTGSSPDTLTPPSSRSETARPDDAAAEPPRKRRRTTEELREIAQTAVDLSRKRPLPRL
ncbi:hypothetical protein FNYG_12780 [Fusarium nygamai]|uniref:Uncharacterized protein n=1 Tax=Gibberella nygamai TaxID=42673 RepID=A0A2K0VUY3_GIBNY|nr:hypothetical protein FNYG_12780 [Fusarium nygamai]